MNDTDSCSSENRVTFERSVQKYGRDINFDQGHRCKLCDYLNLPLRGRNTRRQGIFRKCPPSRHSKINYLLRHFVELHEVLVIFCRSMGPQRANVK